MSITSAASSMSQAQSGREPTSRDTSQNVSRSIDQTDQNLLQFESHDMNANTNKNSSSTNKNRGSRTSAEKSSIAPRNVNLKPMNSLNSIKDDDRRNAIETKSSKPISMQTMAGMRKPRRGRLLERDNPFHQASGNLKVKHFAKNESRSQILALYSDDWFHVLVSMHTWKVLIFLTALITLQLIIFAALYVSVDRSGDACKLGPIVESATGIISQTQISYQSAFAFSVTTAIQTGYGFIGVTDPYYFTCPYFLVVIYFQITSGLLLNAFAVGVLLQRVGRANPRSHQVVFSDKAVIRNINNKFYFSIQVFDLDWKHPVVEAHIRMYAVLHPSGATEHHESMAGEEKSKPPRAESETPENQSSNSIAGYGGIGLGHVLPKSMTKEVFDNVKAKLETEAIKLFDADFKSNVGSDATIAPVTQTTNIPLKPVAEEEIKSPTITTGNSAIKTTLDSKGPEECSSDESSSDSENNSIAFEKTSYHTPYYQTKVMRIQSPNDDLGGVLFLSIPSVVIHQIDSYSPLCPPPFLRAKLRSKQNPKSNINYLFDTETDPNGRLFHSFPGLVLREEDCAAGDRSYCYCPVCGEDFNTKKHLFRHIRYSQYIERIELNEDERDRYATPSLLAPGERQGVSRHLDLDLGGFVQDAARYETLIAPSSNDDLKLPRPNLDISEGITQATSPVADSTAVSVESYKAVGERDEKIAVLPLGTSQGRGGKDKYSSVEARREAIRSHLREKRVEIIVLLEGIEARSSYTFQARHSYTIDDIEFDKFFAPCMEVAPNGRAQVNLNYFHKCIPVPAFVDISGPVQSHT